MPVIQMYEEFGNLEDISKLGSTQDNLHLDNEKLKSFDDGYQAGWDDATSAQQTNENSICVKLAEHLQETSFGFHEAKVALINEARPLFEEILDTLLPEIVKASIGPLVLEKLCKLMRDGQGEIIEIAVPPGNLKGLNALLETQSLTSFVAREQNDLEQGQAFFKIDDH